MARKRKRPPVYVETKPGPFHDDPHLGRLVNFRCKGARLASAEFVNRRDPNWTAVLHRSTHRRGQWQLTQFDAEGAFTDTRSKSCDRLVRQVLTPRGWKIKRIKLAPKAPR